MSDTGSLADLAAAWDRVIATRNASPPDCACRAVTGPLIAEWQEAMAKGHAITSRQWENLRRAQEAQSAPARLPGEEADWTLDVRTPRECAERPRPGAANIPVDDLRGRLSEVPLGARVVVYCQSGLRAARAVSLLRDHGFHACNGHEDSCPLPEVRPVGYQDDVRKGLAAVGSDEAADPRMGAAGDADPAGLFSGLLGAAQGAASGVAGGAGQEAGRQAVAGATEAAKSAIPGLVTSASTAVRGEFPGLVQASGAAAAPVVTPIAEQAGEAAGRGAARGASGEAAAWGVGEKLAAGAVGLLAILGIGYAATRKGKRP